MDKKKIVQLSEEQRTELEKGYRAGKSHAFHTRCQMILLKAEKWLGPTDFGSFARFKKKIKHIFTNIGEEYKIQFSQMMVKLILLACLNAEHRLVRMRKTISPSALGVAA